MQTNSDHLSLSIQFSKNSVKTNNTRPFDNTLIEDKEFQSLLNSELKRFLIREIRVTNYNIKYCETQDMNIKMLLELIPSQKLTLSFIYELIYSTYFTVGDIIQSKIRKNKSKIQMNLIKKYNKLLNSVTLSDEIRSKLKDINLKLKYNIKSSIKNLSYRKLE